MQPLLRRSIDNLRLLSAAAASPPLLFRPLPPPPPPMNTLVTCVFRPRSEAVAGDGLRHGAAPLTGVIAFAAAVAAGFARGRLREVMTWIMTFIAAEAIPLFRLSVLPLSSFQLDPRIIIIRTAGITGRKPGIGTGTASSPSCPLLVPEFRSRLLRRQFPGRHPRRVDIRRRHSDEERRMEDHHAARQDNVQSMEGGPHGVSSVEAKQEWQ